MNWLPSPPTDNLYKFLAIIGGWGVFFIFTFLLALFFQNYEHAEFNKKMSSIYAEEDWNRKAESRVNSLKKGLTGENRIPEISSNFSLKEELLFLSNSMKLSSERLAQLKELTKQPPQNIFPFLASINFDRWLLGALALVLLAFSYGFMQWFVLQRISDEILRLDLILKRTQAKELDTAEVANPSINTDAAR